MSEESDMNQSQENNPREWVAQSIAEGVKDRIPKGELCIDDSLIQPALNCERVGFEERRAFVAGMNLDIFTLSPVYPGQGKRLPGPEECLWPALREWTTETPLFIFALLDGAFEWGLRVFGFQDFLVLPRTSPLTLSAFVQRVEELNQSLIRFLAGSGINGIILADDIAFTKGLMIRPSTLREYFFPSLARQVAVAADYGLPGFYHSDGHYWDVVEDIIAAGFSGLHCIDRTSGMDICQLQAEVGDKLCLWGHLDVSDATRAEDPAQLQDLVISIRQLALGKRFILGTNCGLFAGTDFEGLRLIYRAVAPF